MRMIMRQEKFFRQDKHFVVDILFVLALFGVFAVSALTVVTIGADVYQRTVQDMSRNYDTRTAVSYLTQKVRQADCLLPDGTPGVSLSRLSGCPALVLTEDIDGEAYCTWLYLHDGFLRELCIREGTSPGEDVLSAGQKILALSSLTLAQPEDNLLTVTMTLADGSSRELSLSLHCH